YLSVFTVSSPSEIYTLSLHDALPICGTSLATLRGFGLTIFLLLPILIYALGRSFLGPILSFAAAAPACILGLPYIYFVPLAAWQDRKSTRLNSSHSQISYAVFCLKKK